MMRSKFYTILGFGTLLIDTYLVLTSIASRMMNAEYREHLPLFGPESDLASSPFMVLIIATWTALLAIGCIRADRKTPEDSNTPALIPFVLILGLVWIGHLWPIVWSYLGKP